MGATLKTLRSIGDYTRYRNVRLLNRQSVHVYERNVYKENNIMRAREGRDTSVKNYELGQKFVYS